jgi:hypothetical protein
VKAQVLGSPENVCPGSQDMSCRARDARHCTLALVCLVLLFAFAHPVFGAVKRAGDSAASLVVEVPASEADVVEAVRDVSQDQTVHGTYVYEKEKHLTGAHASASSSVYGDWQEPGKAFYKVADSVLDPRHFVASNGTGEIAVRYVVQSVGPTSTSLRIDAVFVEDSRRKIDRSDGSVESAEYDAVQQRLLAIRQEREQAEQAKQPPELAKTAQQQAAPVNVPREIAAPVDDTSAIRELELRVAELRHQVEAQVIDDGTALRSAPFSRSPLIQTLGARTQVLIVVLTKNWYGVETPDGHHGWIRRRQLESLP